MHMCLIQQHVILKDKYLSKEWLLTSAMTEISIPHFQEQTDHPGMILIRNISIKLYFRWNELDIYRTFQLKLQNAYISKWEFLQNAPLDQETSQHFLKTIGSVLCVPKYTTLKPQEKLWKLQKVVENK